MFLYLLTALFTIMAMVVLIGLIFRSRDDFKKRSLLVVSLNIAAFFFCPSVSEIPNFMMMLAVCMLILYAVMTGLVFYFNNQTFLLSVLSLLNIINILYIIMIIKNDYTYHPILQYA